METEKLRQFKRELEAWVEFNSKSPMTLIDISKLVSIVRGYYIVYPRRAGR